MLEYIFHANHLLRVKGPQQVIKGMLDFKLPVKIKKHTLKFWAFGPMSEAVWQESSQIASCQLHSAPTLIKLGVIISKERFAGWSASVFSTSKSPIFPP